MMPHMTSSRFSHERFVVEAAEDYIARHFDGLPGVHVALAGRVNVDVHWMQGVLAYMTGRPEQAVHRFQRSYAAFTHALESDNRAAVAQRLAFALTNIGRSKAAWGFRLEALAGGAARGHHPRAARGIASEQTAGFVAAGIPVTFRTSTCWPVWP